MPFISSIPDRALRALQANRTPGWQLPAHFLELVYETLSAEGATVTMPVGPHCTNLEGEVDLLAQCVMADVATSAALRASEGASARLATVSMRLSFALGGSASQLVAHTARSTTLRAATIGMAGVTVSMRAGDKVCCSGEASFAILDNRSGAAPHPLPRTSTLAGLEPLNPNELTEPEAEVYQRALNALPEAGFLQRFWDVEPVARDDAADCRMMRGPQVANRVGDVHGGVLIGLAARTAAALRPSGWRLFDIAAQYVAPANAGTAVIARARLRKSGGNLAHVECTLSDEAGKLLVTADATLARLAPT